jgi:hypothetical protein
MYIRFVIHDVDETSGKRQGLFHAMGKLRDSGALYRHEERMYESLRDWFTIWLDKPLSFSRSRRPHAHHEALSCYKDSATVHIAKMYQFA